MARDYILQTVLRSIQLLFITFFLSSCNVIAESVLRTKVVILGAGMTGITAAKTLHEEGVHDFVVVEARSELGGRMQTFTMENGINVELGPNWIHGLGGLPSELNPIYSLAIKHNLTTVFSNTEDLTTFGYSGKINMNKDLEEVSSAWERYLVIAGQRLDNEKADLTARAGFSLSAFKPRNHLQEAAEYFLFDFTFGQPPEVTSFIGAANNNNYTVNRYSHSSNFVTDQRGYGFLVQQEAKEFLNATDSRLTLNHIVTSITYSTEGVQIQTNGNLTIKADHAICTFSLGVLQNDDVKFYPPLPLWKQEAIYGTNMATYTKIFLRFNQSFWAESEFWLYADPKRRGYYPIWQPLDLPGFLPGSNILLVTITDTEARRIAKQSTDETQAEIMGVLRSMYGKDIPDPEEIVYKNWHSDPLFRGSYSNWGASYPFDVFRTLREPLYNRLWFAGEGTKGQKAAKAVIEILQDRSSGEYHHYYKEYSRNDDSNGFSELRSDSLNELRRVIHAGDELIMNAKQRSISFAFSHGLAQPPSPIPLAWILFIERITSFLLYSMKLPVELLDIIVDNVTETSTLLSLGLTCKYLAGIILPNHLFYHTICGRVEQTQLWTYLFLNPNVCRYIRRLEVTEMCNPKMRLSSHIYDIDHPHTNVTTPGNLSPLLWSYELIARALHQMTNLKALEWINAETPVFHAESDIGKEFSNLRFLPRMPGSPFSFRRMPLNGLYISMFGTPIMYPMCNLASITLTSNRDALDCGKPIVDFLATCLNLEHLTLYSNHQALIGHLISLGRWPNLRILALSVSHDHSEVPTTESIKDFVSFHSNIVSLLWRINLHRAPGLSITSLPAGCLPHLRALDADKDLVQSLIATPCIPPRPLKKIIGFPSDVELWEQPERSFQGISKSSLRVVSLSIRSLSQLTNFGDLFPNVECIDVGSSVSTGLWDEDLRHFRIPLMASEANAELTEKLSCLKNLRVILGIQFLHESMEDEENKDRLEWINQLFPYVEFCADRSSGVVLTRKDDSISWKWVDIPLWSKYLGREEDFTIPEERDQIAL